MGTFRDGVSEFVADTQAFTGAALGVARALSPGPNVRLAEGITNRNRQIMTWRLPNGSSVQMYINPENFQVRESKQISSVRTKGGFVMQYWGDNLTQLTLSGTTGSSGIKGIQALRDIYRSENKAFELVAITQSRDLLNEIQNGFDINNAGDALRDLGDRLAQRNFVLRPSLASLALSVLLFYQGVQYKGFFTEFSMTESVSKLGLFDYSMTFMATEIRGNRKNFMPWHREPLADDLAGQLLNGVGNALRGLVGLDQQAPQQFHPENSPLSFGGSSLTSRVGIDSTGTANGFLT